MRFGINYPYLVERPYSLEDAFLFASKVSLNHIGFSGLFLKQMRSTESFINRFTNVAHRYNCTSSFHVSYRDPTIQRSGMLRPTVNVEATTWYRLVCNIAKDVGATFVGMHPIMTVKYPPLVRERQEDLRIKIDEDEIHRLILAVYRELAQYARAQGIQLAVENQPSNPMQYPNTVDDFRVLRDNVEDLYYLLDTGHAYLEGGDACIEAYVNTFEDRLLGVHVSDNHGDADTHLPVGEGTIDFRRVLTALNRHRLDVPLILEIWMKNGFLPSKDRLIEIQQAI